MDWRIRQKRANHLRRVRLSPRGINPVAGDVLIDQAANHSGALVCMANMLFCIVAKREAAVVDAREPAQQDNALRTEGLQADRMERSLQRSSRDGPLFKNFPARYIHPSAKNQPDTDVTTSVHSGQPADSARCKKHSSPRLDQVLGDLAARLGAADHQHGSTV
ncbi:hypothetical protein AJ87_41125 [Rhizobium yanglingense]|nr:hypothetical protein AJ87_41125 [Rhizobium yanglingense]